MKFWRPPTEYGQAKRRWDDTHIGRTGFELTGPMARIWVKHFFPTLGLEAANDTDHCRW